MKADNCLICIFHFNRGRFLKNLISSINRNSNFPTVVFDDDSDDPETLKILEDVKQQHECFVGQRSKKQQKSVTGNLSENMHSALLLARERNFDYTLMLQDDMQIIRPIETEDMRIVQNGFSRNHASCVIHPCFSKANNGIRKYEKFTYTISQGLYERDFDLAAQLGHWTSFGDTGFFSVNKYFEQIGKLLPTEKENEALLRRQGLRMAFLKNPLCHWLPLPSARRDSNLRLKDRLCDIIAGAGVHQLTDMTKEEIFRMQSRSENDLAYPEDYLSSATLPPIDYWSLRGGKSNLRSRKMPVKLLRYLF